MSVSIMEVLQSVERNIDNVTWMPEVLPLVKGQLHVANTLLEKGYNIHTLVEPLLNEFGLVENVPKLEDNDTINQDD